MRKLIAATTLGLLLASGLVAPSANAAAIKTGAACAKAGATTKVSGKTYKCGKNPFVTPTKNTWALKTCFDSYDLYLEAQDAYDSNKDLGPLLGADGQAQLNEMKTSADSLYNLLKTKICKKGA